MLIVTPQVSECVICCHTSLCVSLNFPSCPIPSFGELLLTFKFMKPFTEPTGRVRYGLSSLPPQHMACNMGCLSITPVMVVHVFFPTRQDETGNDISMVNIKLATGRHHQIRVQMANMGCPIWGDAKYNTALLQDRRFRQIALCAYKLEFVHPKTKKAMEFEIEPEGEGFKMATLSN